MDEVMVVSEVEVQKEWEMVWWRGRTVLVLELGRVLVTVGLGLRELWGSRQCEVSFRFRQQDDTLLRRDGSRWGSEQRGSPNTGALGWGGYLVWIPTRRG